MERDASGAPRQCGGSSTPLTSEVYGDSHGCTRSRNPITARHPYRAAPPATTEWQAVAETILSDFTRSSTGLPVRISRIFNTYGPRMASGKTAARRHSNFIVPGPAWGATDDLWLGSAKRVHSCFMMISSPVSMRLCTRPGPGGTGQSRQPARNHRVEARRDGCST